jgi:hypothetical protein
MVVVVVAMVVANLNPSARVNSPSTSTRSLSWEGSIMRAGKKRKFSWSSASDSSGSTVHTPRVRFNPIWWMATWASQSCGVRPPPVPPAAVEDSDEFFVWRKSEERSVIRRENFGDTLDDMRGRCIHTLMLHPCHTSRGVSWRDRKSCFFRKFKHSTRGWPSFPPSPP